MNIGVDLQVPLSLKVPEMKGQLSPKIARVHVPLSINNTLHYRCVARLFRALNSAFPL